ncbi:protein-L-isoaspartate O-methyltransferase family protein [Thermaurantiacus sp.]
MIESQLMPCGIINPRLLAAFAAVPRERFVAAGREALAYAETVQPIGSGRWMAAPLATARLLSAADVKPGERALLVGAGTGVTAALLAEMGAAVIALEADATLAERAQSLLARYLGVTLVTGPLTAGWPDEAPYDLILFDGAVEFVPDALAAQLKQDGRIAAILAGADGVHRVSLGRAIPPPSGTVQGEGKDGTRVAFDALSECAAPLLPGFSLPRTFRF